MPSPKICLLDIETAPALAFVWGQKKYDQTVIEFSRPWHMLSFAHQILGETEVECRALPDFYTRPGNDKKLIESLWKVVNAADVVVAHNAKYDVGRFLARAAIHGLRAPSPFKVICTYKMSKPFGFSSRKLDDLAADLEVGRKLPHQGFRMWKDCMASLSSPAWEDMRRYNCHDVELLRGVYERLRGFGGHPDLNLISRQDGQFCPTCQSPNIQNRGYNFSRTGKRQRVQCMACGCWSSTGPFIKIA